MTRDDIENEYFEWLYELVCERRYSDQISYVKIFTYLHRTEFRYIVPICPRDENRAADGVGLRYKFALANGYKKCSDTIEDILSGPCSVLEMMIALAVRCETTIMDDPAYGDRTSQWFWEMMVSLGLGSMRDCVFNEDIASKIIERFLDREYSPNGKGGLFTIKNCNEDLRTVEIWYQLYLYLNTFV